MIQTIIGASPTRTAYRIRTLTGDHYVRCGADLLLNGIRGDLEAEGVCPICKSIVRFQVGGRKVQELRPSGSRLHVVEIRAEKGRHVVECEGSHLFDREICLHNWLDDYKGRPGVIFKLQEFLDHAIRLRESEAS